MSEHRTVFYPVGVEDFWNQFSKVPSPRELSDFQDFWADKGLMPETLDELAAWCEENRD